MHRLAIDLGLDWLQDCQDHITPSQIVDVYMCAYKRSREGMCHTVTHIGRDVTTQNNARFQSLLPYLLSMTALRISTILSLHNYEFCQVPSPLGVYKP